MTIREQKIYDSSGGGEKGDRAVKAYREYVEQQRAVERQYAKEHRYNRYTCRNEKTTVTLPTVEDGYD